MATPAQPASGLAPLSGRSLALWALAVSAAHLLVLHASLGALRPASALRPMDTPDYTRPLTPSTPTPSPTAAAPSPADHPPSTVGQRVQARLLPALPASPPAAAAPLPPPPPSKPRARPAPPSPEAPTPADPPASAQAPSPPPTDAILPPEPLAAPPQAEPPAAAMAEPPAPAVAAAPARPPEAEPAADATPPWAHWPPSTRLRYRLHGYARGEVHGSAQVEWRRQDDRYQAQVAVDVGLLLHMRFTSQGRILADRLWPEIYEEERRGKRRSARFGEDWVTLDNGSQLPRPADLQDTASQFVQLSQALRTGRLPAVPGATATVTLARPGGIDRWVYDLQADDPIPTPLGTVSAILFKPRPLAEPRGSVTAQMWYAPELQHLPVRIRLQLNADAWLELSLQDISQAP